MPSYENTLDYLFSLQNSGIKLGLERIEALMALLRFPYNDYPTVLVGGTNGKGSVSAILASILKEAGYRVALYTSPHLVRFNERIRVDGVKISDAELVELTEKLRALVEGSPDQAGLPSDLSPTFFEFTTALALTYFQEKGVDIAILEVGMGGRLDATNVVSPKLSIITSIALDHESSLGDDIAGIAGEKAGIIKKGSSVVSGLLCPKARSVIERISDERGAKLFMAGDDFKVEDAAGGGFDYSDSAGEIPGLKVSLYGAHQQQNAALAIRALGELSDVGFCTSPGEIKRGLSAVVWPGRCELVKSAPKVILDCAHNESAASALCEALSGFTYRRLILVLGIMADKDIVGILTKLAQKADHLILTSPKVKRAEKPGVLMAKAEELIARRGLSVTLSVAGSVEEAILSALDMAKEDDLICVSGSVFTVGEAMSFFEQL